MNGVGFFGGGYIAARRVGSVVVRSRVDECGCVTAFSTFDFCLLLEGVFQAFVCIETIDTDAVKMSNCIRIINLMFSEFVEGGNHVVVVSPRASRFGQLCPRRRLRQRQRAFHIL